MRHSFELKRITIESYVCITKEKSNFLGYSYVTDTVSRNCKVKTDPR